jgi:hypothetical protein
MFSFRRSLNALVGSLVLGGAIAAFMPLVSSGQGKQLKRDSRRSFYLTQTEHTGSQALTACAEAYHMASLWEILDPSNLRYNTELGYTRADSGSGPPVAYGFARTGREALGGGPIGAINCHAWTSDSELGSVFILAENIFDGEPKPISPWVTVATSCSSTFRVWCVEN